MHDPKSLEAFYLQYLPTFKAVIEEYWNTDRKELVAFLSDCVSSESMPSWMNPYFLDTLQRAKTVPHTYTDPWATM